MQQKIYFKNLDALRFFAALAVILSHVIGRFEFPETFFAKAFRVFISFDNTGGDAGVSFFFVLSGFLITYLMFAEDGSTGTINVGYFYIRRALRIWPLYYLTLVIGFIIYPLLKGSSYIEHADWRLYAAFLTNFDHIYFGWPQNGMLGVQWSVAVEEQFYILWPLIFLCIGKRKIFPVIVVIGIILSVALRASGFHKYHTLTASADLLIGAFIAYASFFYKANVEIFINQFSKRLILIIYIIGLSLIMLNFQLTKNLWWYGSMDRFIHALFFSFVILEQNYSNNSFLKFGSVKIFTWLGKISYGLYSLHMVAIYIVIYCVDKFPISVWLQLPLAILLTIALSYLSYNYYEKKFLNLKNRFTKITVDEKNNNHSGSSTPIY